MPAAQGRSFGELQTAYASAPNNVFIWETLELRHSRFSRVFYFTTHGVQFDAFLETGGQVSFDPIPFTVKLPRSDGAGPQELQISISNVGQDMVNELEAAAAAPQERIECIYRVYTSTDLSGPSNIPVRLSISQLAMTVEAVVGSANRADVVNRKFASDVYDTGENGQFPGLDR
jgi:hypothetical protein